LTSHPLSSSNVGRGTRGTRDLHLPRPESHLATGGQRTPLTEQTQKAGGGVTSASSDDGIDEDLPVRGSGRTAVDDSLAFHGGVGVQDGRRRIQAERTLPGSRVTPETARERFQRRWPCSQSARPHGLEARKPQKDERERPALILKAEGRERQIFGGGSRNKGLTQVIGEIGVRTVGRGTRQLGAGARGGTTKYFSAPISRDDRSQALGCRDPPAKSACPDSIAA